jgi:geranyl-CoA carboxylase alpha subunit
VPRFAKLLIANRGEIAVRIARTARALGLRSVAVYSDPDRNSPHVGACDEAVPLVGVVAADSYLSIERVIAAAQRSGADAVHPGYGFLSENAEFAEACEAAGLVFVGPPAEAIRLMGNKAAAKARMLEAGVPCVPGYHGAQGAEAFARAAREIGFPVMVKAAAGGGGKGMRLVDAPERLPAALEATREEALRAFGSSQLLLERALEAPRHVEIQIFADAFEQIVHLGERDCSIQRRHQKIIEESPSPAVSPELRERMGRAAIDAARAVGYVGAGTVEFLLDADAAFYFLEMNTRLQVEHAVTEALTGIDLVAWQLRVAAGEPLPLDEPRAVRSAHAIEARLYAEDPANDFLPQAGRVVAWNPPRGEGIRVDHALAAGLEISPYYDPMLAKIVAAGANREQARRRLVAALEDLTLFGLTTNRRFLIECLEQPTFVSAEARTDFVPRFFASPATGARTSETALLALAAALVATHDANGSVEFGWRSSGVATVVLKLRLEEAIHRASIVITGAQTYTVTIDGERRSLALLAYETGRVRFVDGGVERTALFAWDGPAVYLQSGRNALRVVDATFADYTEHAPTAPGSARSPMPGIVTKVAVAVGDPVTKGQILIVLEAMKMLHEIVASAEGRVSNVLVAPGQQVGMRALLVEIESNHERVT